MDAAHALVVCFYRIGLRFLFLFGFEADAAEEDALDEEEEEDEDDDEEPASSRAFRARRATYSSRMRAQPLEMVAGALALPLLLIVVECDLPRSSGICRGQHTRCRVRRARDYPLRCVALRVVERE